MAYCSHKNCANRVKSLHAFCDECFGREVVARMRSEEGKPTTTLTGPLTFLPPTPTVDARTYLAGQALSGLLACSNSLPSLEGLDNDQALKVIAKSVTIVADAVLRELKPLASTSLPEKPEEPKPCS